MTWTAALSSSSLDVVVTRTTDGVVYRTDVYPLERLQCRYWTEQQRSYTSLIYDRIEEVIKITSEATNPNFGNQIFGSAAPVAAYNNFITASGSNGATAASAANQLAANATLTGILAELANDKAFEDLLVQDANKNYFVRQEVLDQSTNITTVALFNLDGSAPTSPPVVPIVPAKTGSDTQIIEDKYTAPVAGIGYLAGAILASVRILSSTTGAVLAAPWYNLSTQTLLTTAPNLTALLPYESATDQNLTAIASQTLIPNIRPLTASDIVTVVFPSTAPTEATQLVIVNELAVVNTQLAAQATVAQQVNANLIAAAIAQNTLQPNVRPLTAAVDTVTVSAPTLATAAKQDLTNAAVDAIAINTATAATETTLLAAKNTLDQIEQQTLVPNTRPLTAAVDTVTVSAPTLATSAKQDLGNAALLAIELSAAAGTTEATQLLVKDTLAQIEQHTLVPNTRPLTASIDTVTVSAPTLATVAKQDEEILALETIGTNTALAATEATLLAARNNLAAIEQNTLAPNIRPLTTADVVTVNAPTLATAANQVQTNVALTAIQASVAAAPTATQQDTANTTLASIAGSAASSATVALQGVMIAALQQILAELSKQKEFEDLLVQDSAGTVFIRREQLDESTNVRTITIENFDGSVAAPVGAITTVKQVRANSIQTRNYYAKVDGSGFIAGDSLATLQIVNGETNNVSLLGWFNITQQTAISTPDASAVAGYEDRIEEQLTKLVAQLPASLGTKPSSESLAVTLANDTTLPLPLNAATESTLLAVAEALGILLDNSFPNDETADATVKGLIRLMSKRIANASADELAAIGPALETDLIGSPGDFGSLKAVSRGAWYDTQNILGSTGDVSTGGIFDAGSVKMLIRALGLLITNGEQLTRIYDPVTEQRASITAPTQRASNEPALVVAISPDTPIDVNQLPGNIQADIAAIRVNTARISQYEFNLAQTTAGLVFLIRTDGVTGVSTNINIATGLAFAPGSIEMNDPVVAPTAASTKVIEPNEFTAKTTVAGKWVAEDILTRITIVDVGNNTISGTIWQDAAGNLLSQTPVLGIDVEDTNKTQLALIKAQPTAGTPVTGEALATGSGTYGWLSYIRSTLAGMAGNLASIITNTATPNIRPLTAADTVTVVLPGTAATAGNQTVGNGFLSTLVGRTPTLGQKTGANSSPVVLASDTPVPALITDGALNAAIKASNTPSAITDNALVTVLRPDSNVVVSGLPGSIQADIAAIRTNTARISQYQFQLVEDAIGTVFVARWDTVTGSVTNLTLGGSIYTPSGALDVVASGGGGSSLTLEVNEFEAQTTRGSEWAPGDVLTRVLIVNTATGSISSTIWQAANTAITLTAIPTIGIDVIDTDKQQLALLRALPSAGTPVAGESLATGAGMFGWLSRISSKLQTGSQLLAGTIATSNVRQVTTSLAVTGANNNVLDATGAGNPTDVTNYNSCRIVITTGSNSFAYQLNSDLGLTNWIDSNGVQVGGVGTIAPGQTVSFTVNLSNLSFLRLISSTNSIGTTVAITMSQAFDSQRAVVALSPAQSLGAVASVGAILDTTPIGVVIGGTGGVITLSNLDGRNTATFAVTGSWLGTLQVQVSLDGTNWSTISTNHVQNLLTKTFQSNQITANGIYQTQIAGFAHVRLIAISWVTGNATTIARASIANLSVTIEGQVNPNATSISQISDAATASTIPVLGANSSALILNGRGVATFGIGGTWSGTIQAQLSADGVDWYNIATNNAIYDLKNKIFNNNGNITVNGLYQVNVSGLGQVRLISTVWATGIANITGRASSASSLIAIEGQVNAQISNTNLLVRSDSVSNSSDLSGTITTTTSSITFSQIWGVSRATEINITAISPGTSYTCEWQEPVGTGWRTVYRFETTSNTGVRRSPLLPNINSNWRYLETISGATPSVTRSITRTQSNLDVDSTLNTNQLGGFNFSDLPVAGRTRAITANNNSAVKLFLQVHDKATLLVTGDTPINGRVYPIPPGGVVVLGVGDLGPNGTQLGLNTRLALSTAFSTWISPAGVSAPNQTFSLHAEVI
jgi:hypothetical protein